MKVNIEEIINKYLEYFPNEKEQLEKLNDFIKEDAGDIFNSKNINGHITASGYIYNKKDNTLLLLEHKKANRLLQPGGHSEECDSSPLDTVIREIYEETGLKDLKICSIDNDILVPMDINTHFIPKNNKKEMPEHYHHDFRYLFIVDDEKNIKIDINESNNYKWVNIEEIQDNEIFSLAIKKIKKILNN